MKSFVLLGGVCLMASAMPARAAAEERPRPAIVSALLECKKHAVESQRLACYDAAVAQVEQALGTGRVVVVDQTEMRRMRRSLFGLNIPKIPLLSGNDSEEPEELTATIQAASADRFNKWTLILENGAIWRTTQALKGFPEPRAGGTVKLRRGTMGGYWLTVGNGRAVRAVRER